MEKQSFNSPGGFSTLETDDASSCPSIYYDSGVCMSFTPSVKSGIEPGTISEIFEQMKIGGDAKSSAAEPDSAREVTSGSIVMQEESSSPSDELFKQDDDGDTHLHLAVINTDIKATLYLIDEAPIPEYLDIQNDDFLHSALHLAVITNQPTIVRALVISGARLTTRDKKGNTPLHIACARGHLECVKQLLAPPTYQEVLYIRRHCTERGFPNRIRHTVPTEELKVMNYDGETCLHLACSSTCDDRFNIISYLVRNCNADVNMQEGKCGFTILHQSIKSKDLQSVGFILGLPSVSLDMPCYCGSTAVGIAACLENSEMVSLLLSYGASYLVDSAEPAESNDLDDEFDDVTIGGQLLN